MSMWCACMSVCIERKNMAGLQFWEKKFDLNESREGFCQRGRERYILKEKNSIQIRAQEYKEEDKEELKKTKKNSRRQRRTQEDKEELKKTLKNSRIQRRR